MRGYKATQNADGTWNILDVPIMANFKGGRENLKEVDREWLDSAIERHQSRFRDDGYLPPCHIHHHGDGDSGKATSRAGHFRLTRTMPQRFEGGNRWVLYADLIDVPDPVYQRIKGGELPYRSVEILSPNGPPEVDSLALLDDDVPFFRFDLLKISEESPNTETAPTVLSEANAPAVAMCGDSGGKAKRVFFRFQEERMDPNETGGGATLDDVMTALAGLPQAIVSALKGEAAEEENLGDASPVDEQMAEDDKDDEKMMEEGSAEGDMLSEDRSDVAKLSASVSALTERLNARDAKDDVAARISIAHEELQGWPMGDTAKKALAHFAARGQSDLDVWVAQFKTDVPQDPPKTFDAFSARVGGEDPEEVQKFAAEGADVLHMARRANGEFAGASQQPGFSLSRGRFIDMRVEAAKRKAAETEEVAS